MTSRVGGLGSLWAPHSEGPCTWFDALLLVHLNSEFLSKGLIFSFCTGPASYGAGL